MIAHPPPPVNSLSAHVGVKVTVLNRRYQLLTVMVWPESRVTLLLFLSADGCVC